MRVPSTRSPSFCDDKADYEFIQPQRPGYSILNTKVLILNRSYLPIHVTSVKRAFVLLYQGIAKAVNEQYQTFDFDSWSDLVDLRP